MALRSEVVFDHCHKATMLGNKISIHLLDFLSSVKVHPQGFNELAHDFLDVCRIMWSIEAGLNECSRTHQDLPADMLQELDKKFKTTHADFQLLDQWLTKFLESERRGTVGKIQRGWRKMFADTGVDKMSQSLKKTKEALRMSALIFQWSLGDAKIDESVGIGYTGLAAALERMDRGRSVVGINKLKTLEPHISQLHIIENEPLDDFPVMEFDKLSPISPIGHLAPSHTSESYRHSPSHISDAHSSHSFSQNRRASISNQTVSSNGARERGVVRRSQSVENGVAEDRRSGGTTGSETLLDEEDLLDNSPIKAVRIKSDPFTMPRWTPRNSVGANTPALQEALLSAIEARNSKLVEQLLDRGVSPDTSPEANALKEAIRHHDVEIVRLLLLFGADPNSGDAHGITPLYAAVEESFVDGATMLLKYGADCNKAGQDLESPLSLSILEDKFNLTRLFLMYNGDANHSMNDGDTVLIKAISLKRHKKHIDLLLEYGSDPNGKNREGRTPLFEAIQTSRLDIVTALLDRGANPNLPGPKHMLWPATWHTPILKLLLARGADHKKTPGIMELAASTNNIESVRVLLKAGVDPNAKKDGTYTPLCTSIRDNRPDIFQLLLANGANPNVPASEYPAFKCVTHFRPQYLAPLVDAGADLNSPKGILEQAVQSNNNEALIWLLDAGVSPNDKTPKTNATPLTTAIRENRVEMVDLLLNRGADPNVRGQDWPVCMAVHQPTILKRLLPALAEPRAFKGVMEMAVVANELESIKLLLRAGVSVEDRNGGVFSPLTTAIREGRKEIVKFLLEEAGADPNAPGEHLPIVKALRRLHDGDTEILEMVLAHGADPNKVYRGHNAIIQALENGDASILKLLVDRCGVDFDAKDDSGRNVVEIADSRGWVEAGEILHAARPAQQVRG